MATPVSGWLLLLAVNDKIIDLLKAAKCYSVFVKIWDWDDKYTHSAQLRPSSVGFGSD